MLLELRDIHVSYGQIEAVKGVSIQIPEKSIVSSLGANGSGKSTVLKAISGIKRLTRGEICFKGQRIDHFEPKDILKLGIAHVPEGRKLFSYMTVVENLNMGAYTRKDRKKVKRDIGEIFDRFKVLKEKKNDLAGTLSGGQQEILAIARALMAKPRLLLLDEPLQGMSPVAAMETEKIVNDLNQSGVTILMVEHNVHMALGMADRIYILENGMISFEGDPNELSENEYTQEVYLGRGV